MNNQLNSNKSVKILMKFFKSDSFKLSFTILYFSLSFFLLPAQDLQNISKTNKKPISGFIENKGQIYDQNNNPNPEVRYLLNTGKGLNVQLKTNSFSYDTYIIEKKEREKNEIDILMHPFDSLPEYDITYHFHRVDVEMINANPNPEIIAEFPSDDYYNFYNSVTSESGAVFVRYYQKVTYKNIYPLIDLEFTTKPDSFKPFEYNFIIHPGGDASRIRFKFKGADSVFLSDEKIRINFTHGYFYEQIPVSFLLENNKVLNITYIQTKASEYGFKVPKYNKKTTLIIDPYPFLVWATYYGGTDLDQGESICADNTGSLYISGSTSSTNAIATSGAYQSVFSGNLDIFILKADTSGKRIWATYYGNDSSEEYSSILFKNNKIYLCGNTRSISGMSTILTHQVTNNGKFDVFLAKFDTSGMRIWGTYYGGSSEDNCLSIDIDQHFNIYITGSTSSIDNIATLGAYQSNLSGNGRNGFLCKFNDSGKLIWGSYFGQATTYLRYITLNNNHSKIVVCGQTNSIYNIASTGCYQSVFGGWEDAVIAEFDTSGKIKWSTYYGGTGIDAANSVFVDSNNFIYVAGSTSSSTAISSKGVHQDKHGGGFVDGFIVKFDTNEKRIWCTYIGGAGKDNIYRISQYINNKLLILGTTSSENNISSSKTYQKFKNKNTDMFINCFDSDCNRCWGTYYGGNKSEGDLSWGMTTLDTSIFITFRTGSDSFLCTSHPTQPLYGGISDAVIAKFIEIQDSVFDTIIVSACDSFYFNNKYLTQSGTYFDTIKLPCNCDSIIVLLLTICPKPSAQFNVNDTIQCLNNNLFQFINNSKIDSNFSTSYLWNFGNNDSSALENPAYHYTTADTFNVELIVANAFCQDTAYKKLYVMPSPVAVFTVSDTAQFLNGNSFSFTNLSGPTIDSLSFYWDFGDNSYDTIKNPSHSYSDTGKYTAKLTVTSRNGCNDSFSKLIYVLKAFNVDFLFDSLCLGDSTVLYFSANPPDSIISILWDLDNDSLFNDASGSLIKIKFQATGNYRIGMKVNTTKSFSTVYKVIPIYQSPIADFFLPDFICQNQLFSIQDKTILFGDSIIRYYWDFNNDNIVDDSTGSKVSTQYSSGGNKFIRLSVISSQGCFDSVVKTTYVSFKPTADFDVINRCANDTAWIINKSSIINDSIKMLFWNYGDGKDAIIKIDHGHLYTSAGIYSIQLIASSNYFCKDTITKSIEIYPQPSVFLSFSDSTTIYSDQYLTVTAFGNFTSNLWSTGDTVKIITVNTKGYYKITVFSANGCKDTASFYLNILENPEFKITDVITPNGDNINDYLKIFNLDYFKPVSIRIFNRYGDLLFASDNYNNNWDATYKGNNLPENAYFYLIKTKQGNIFKGTINVVR